MVRAAPPGRVGVPLSTGNAWPERERAAAADKPGLAAPAAAGCGWAGPAVWPKAAAGDGGN